MAIIIENQIRTLSTPSFPGAVWEICRNFLGGKFTRLTRSRRYLQAGLLNNHIASNEKPAWAHLPDRTWKRHSAFLTCLHEMQRND